MGHRIVFKPCLVLLLTVLCRVNYFIYRQCFSGSQNSVQTLSGVIANSSL